jgi:integrase/recombinase XerD
MNEGSQLYDPQGRRLSLTVAERDACLSAAMQADRPIRPLCTVLSDTGCWISEALALTPRRIDLNAQTMLVATLKTRRRGFDRAVPVPQALLETIDVAHGLRAAQQRPHTARLDARLWSFARHTAWRQVTAVRCAAGIPDGPHCVFHAKAALAQFW